MISGDDAFKLKDTYGLPIEEILLIAKDSELTVDEPRYLQLEEEAKQRSRNVHKVVHQMAGENVYADFVKQYGETKFSGYTHDSTESSIIALVVDGEFVQEMQTGQEGLIFLTETPFYAEMGGQVGDTGYLEGPHQTFIVQDCVAPYKGLIAHKGILKNGTLTVGETVIASGPTAVRLPIITTNSPPFIGLCIGTWRTSNRQVLLSILCVYALISVIIKLFLWMKFDRLKIWSTRKSVKISQSKCMTSAMMKLKSAMTSSNFSVKNMVLVFVLSTSTFQKNSVVEPIHQPLVILDPSASPKKAALLPAFAELKP